MPETTTGTVKWFRRSYGFLATPIGDMFVHYSAIEKDARTAEGWSCTECDHAWLASCPACGSSDIGQRAYVTLDELQEVEVLEYEVGPKGLRAKKVRKKS